MNKNIETVKKLLIGQTIDHIEEDKLYLKNGGVVTVFESFADCCAVADGVFKNTRDDFQAAITDVTVNYEFTEDYTDTGEITLTLLHNGEGIVDMNGYADAGNSGYYFSTLALSFKNFEYPDFDIDILTPIDNGDDE